MAKQPFFFIDIKEEPEEPGEYLEEEEEDLDIACRLCTKSFCNELALRNHLRMEHSGVEVDLQEWVQASLQERQRPAVAGAAGAAAVAARAAELVAGMRPTNIVRSLASEDVNYIIIKVDEDAAAARRRRRITAENEAADKRARRARDPAPITGPFECLAPAEGGSCHQVFLSCCEYSLHFRTEHTRRRKAIRCQVCEKVLPAAGGEDAPVLPHPCLSCCQSFATAEELAAHRRAAHVKAKPFACSVCGKRFTQQGGVAQHMRAHNGQRPYGCPHCEKSFTQKSGLDQHLRIHTKDKPYRCVICNKTFVQSVHLRQHMRTHTNVAPFKCVICEKRFKQSSHLNYHLKNHTEANMSEAEREKYKRLMGMLQTSMTEESSEPEMVLLDGEHYVLSGDTWTVETDKETVICGDL